MVSLLFWHLNLDTQKHIRSLEFGVYKFKYLKHKT